MKFATQEIRTAAVNAFMSGQATIEQLVNIFGYTQASIYNWVRDYKKNNRLAPRPNGHRKGIFSEEELKQLSELLEKNVDMTLAEIREHFKKECSLVTIHKTVVKLGFVFKKNAKGKRTRTQGCGRG